jgi:ankyrin repeat protein
MLLKKGAKVDSEDEDRRTPLSWAAERGHEAVVQLLLEEGADDESKDKNGRTPLSWATEERHKPVMKLLQSHAVKLS